MAFDAKSAAAEIVRLVGGKENINSVAHCMTRLRFVVKDLKKADQEALKKVPGVLGVIYAGGQLMVVLGKNLLPVYETWSKTLTFWKAQQSTKIWTLRQKKSR